jgi:hypothetical protein
MYCMSVYVWYVSVCICICIHTEISFSCTFSVWLANCVCKIKLLFMSLFKPGEQTQGIVQALRKPADRCSGAAPAAHSINFEWRAKYDDLGCSAQTSGSLLKAHLDRRFPSWLHIDLSAWTILLNHSIAVLHFRGGDIFRAKPNYTYTYYCHIARLRPLPPGLQPLVCHLRTPAWAASPCVAERQTPSPAFTRPQQPEGLRRAGWRVEAAATVTDVQTIRHHPDT